MQAAKRGIEVEVTIPVTAGLDAGQTSVYYGDEQVGLLSSLSADENNEETFKRHIINRSKPSQPLEKRIHVLCLKNRKLDLGDVANPEKILPWRLLLEIIPGSGESKTQI